MALSKVDYNSLNVTAAASKALKWNSSADGFETGDLGGSLTLLTTNTISSSVSTSTFSSSIDSTYKEYIFKGYNIHTSNDNVRININFRDGSTSYDATKTTSPFYAYHKEDDTATTVGYNTGMDLTQSTSAQVFNDGAGSGNDECVSFCFHLYDPSSTTFVKHFMGYGLENSYNDISTNVYVSGYANVTAAIDGVQFGVSAGTLDSGVIKMYGVS